MNDNYYENHVIIDGVIESIIYQNELNGYTVFSVNREEETENGKSAETEITCTATMPQLNIGEHVRLTGFFVFHPSYGRQFKVELFEKTLPTTQSGLEKYLGSGVIKGVGEKLAKRIVDKFGESTISVIENTPELLSEIRGISLEKALTIGTVFAEQSSLRTAMIYLQGYGISSVYALKIYKKYKQNTVDILKSNPYALADDIIGIGFKTADSIAAKVGIPPDSPFRIKAGVKYVLNQAANNGHVYLPKDELLNSSADLLELPHDVVDASLVQMQFERIIWQEKIDGQVIIYLNIYYYAESYVAKKLLELSENSLDKSENVKAEIAEIEREENIELAEEQKRAVEASLENGVLVITGGPGTGKTTTINTIIKLLKKEGLEIELAAPTGRAAKRMTEATGREARTIHRLLGMGYLDGQTNESRRSFEKNEDEPLDCDVCIVDESSMVDIILMYNLLRAIEYGTKLLLVGDVDQLPSVGPGNVLKDIIASGKIKVIRLNEIFRQAQQSDIVMNAHKINNGEYPAINRKGSDFYFVKRANVDDVVSTIIELVTKRLPDYADCSGAYDIQVLTPMRKSPMGVNNLNQVLQNVLNPPSGDKKQKDMRVHVFREGDKVMQIKNNYNMQWKVLDRRGTVTGEGTGVFNGDEGIIKRIDDFNEIITVAYDEDNKLVDYDYSQLDELELSYAVTIHKSQGSEYNVVVIPIHSGPPMLMSRNLLYTAITRAKNLAVIVGIPETLCRMVDNNREVNRYTTLCHRIVKMSDFMSSGG